VGSAAAIPLRDASFFDRDVDEVARALIGVTLTFRGVGGVIVETESYDASDPASHAYDGRMTERNRAMFGPAGHAYVYRSYGIHWCLNFVCRPASAVLIRALQPRVGLRRMRERRGTDELTKLCSGPGNLCQALGIIGADNGRSLLQTPFRLTHNEAPVTVCSGPRVGISKAAHAIRRYGLAGSPYLSRRFPRPPV
jgi:DNA-3-methyladenine glycosylase